MFLNCQKPGLIKDPYIYKPDSIMLDLEDAVAEKVSAAQLQADAIPSVFRKQKVLKMFIW